MKQTPTVADLWRLLRAEYSLKGPKAVQRATYTFGWVLQHLGDRLASDLVRSDLVDYVVWRRQTIGRYAGKHPSDSTIKLELNYLRRAMRLAQDEGLLDRVPRFPVLHMNRRRGFFEADQLQAVVRELPERWRAPIQVAALTGWRLRSEVLTRQWRHVDMAAGWLRLDPGETKNRDGRVFPLTAQLRAVLETQRAAVDRLERTLGRIIPWAFCDEQGAPLNTVHTVWTSACRRAGVVGRVPHDLRRTAIRAFERAGLPRSAGMALSGHRDESMYSSYAIVDETLLNWAGRMLDDAPSVAIPALSQDQRRP